MWRHTHGGNEVDGRADPLADGKTALGEWREQRDWLSGGAGVGAAWGHVLLACRNAEKGQAALKRLKRGAPGTAAELVEVDMASLASIRSFATAFAGREFVDPLINVLADGVAEARGYGRWFERQFGTNHLGHFALTGFLPPLLAAPAPRVVTVASLAHRNGEIDFDDLQSERGYKPLVAYGESKLANILFAKELDRRARGA